MIPEYVEDLLGGRDLEDQHIREFVTSAVDACQVRDGANEYRVESLCKGFVVGACSSLDVNLYLIWYAPDAYVQSPKFFYHVNLLGLSHGLLQFFALVFNT